MELFNNQNIIITQRGELRIIKNGANYTVEANGFDFPEFASVLGQRISAHSWEFIGALNDKATLAALLKRILEQG